MRPSMAAEHDIYTMCGCDVVCMHDASPSTHRDIEIEDIASRDQFCHGYRRRFRALYEMRRGYNRSQGDAYECRAAQGHDDDDVQEYVRYDDVCTPLAIAAKCGRGICLETVSRRSRI